MQTFDVTIIGGGPGGCATAIRLKQLAPELRVALIDRRHASFSGQVGTRVGESLPPQIRSPLQQLGLWQEFSAHGHPPNPRMFVSWSSARARFHDAIWDPLGPGFRVDRPAFDRMLRARAEQSVDWFAAPSWTIVAGDRFGGSAGPNDRQPLLGFRLKKSDGSSMTIQARHVVDASGRNGVFARKSGAQKVFHDRLVGIFSTLRVRREEGWPTLIESARLGWWYRSELPGTPEESDWTRIVLGFMSDLPLAQRRGLLTPKGWLAALQQSEFARRGLALERKELGEELELSVRRAESFFLEGCDSSRWIAAGDSQMGWDPLAGQGIHRALEEGCLGALALVRMFGGEARSFEEYRRSRKQDYLRYLEKRSEYYQQENRWLDSAFWLPRHPSNFTKGKERSEHAFA